MTTSVDPFDLIQPGALVAIGDGASAPVELYAALTRRAREVGHVRLLLGWSLTPFDGIDVDAFDSISVLMGGYFATSLLRSGEATYLPARFGALPSLLVAALRPDVMISAVSDRADGWHFTTDVGWQRVVVDAGVPVIAVARAGPSGDGGSPIDPGQVHLAEVEGARHRPDPLPAPANSVMERIAEHVIGLIEPQVRLQYAPGALGAAVLHQLTTAVSLDTGVLNDAARDLDERGLLVGLPIAPYCIGDDATMSWLGEHRPLAGVEVTHDPGRLVAGAAFVALNTALQVDLDGQVGIETVNDRVVAGVGGQPDYMAAGTVSRDGLSIIALPTTHARHSTLVDRLDGAVSTASHDVDVVVTENGVGWLRGLDRTARRRVLSSLWE